MKTLKQRLKNLWLSTPENAINFELHNETHRLLAGLEASELSDFFGELPPPGGLPAHVFFRLEVLKAWARKDGPAAVLNCASGLNSDTYCRARAIGAWCDADPDAALAWLHSADLPSEPNLGRILRANLLGTLARTDLARVIDELPRLDQRERLSIARDLVVMASDQKEQLEKLLAVARESTPQGKMSAAEENLLLKTTKADPQAALDQLDSATHLDASERKRLDISVLDAHAYEAPVPAFAQWLERNPGMDSFPQEAHSTLSLALANHTEAMSAWLEHMPTGQLRDSFYEHGVCAFAESGRFEEALRFSSSIADPVMRDDSLRAMHAFWKTIDAAGAREWIQSLPSTDRALFED
ncbi:hypothetical protein [Haloferula sp. BvORR071]|uniref:hypothetical protein n=1 Tax=Haloferula sp. BvORR071 TaxID=1396141 RepID=UPI0005533C6A|nr:hypothetical protein [Haloferula sp. BvORR071]